MKITYFISCSFLYPRLIHIGSININYRKTFFYESIQKRLRELLRELMELHETIVTKTLTADSFSKIFCNVTLNVFLLNYYIKNNYIKYQEEIKR